MTFNGKELSDMTAEEISHVLLVDTDKLTSEQKSWFDRIWEVRKQWEYEQTDEYKHRNDFLLTLAWIGLGIFIGLCLSSNFI